MRYDPDLARLSLDAYRELLAQQNLLPSRQALLDGIEEKFSQLKALGVTTVAKLQQALSIPAKIAGITAKSGVPAAYLVILKREAGTLKQKPVPLACFPETDKALIESLLAKGIKTSKDYYESQCAGGELYALCDLVRINGVGPCAARMFYEAGYRSVLDVAQADAPALLNRITAVNDAKRYYQGKLGEKDMQFCIGFANVLLRLCE
jgi:predicted RecB family nuclease